MWRLIFFVYFIFLLNEAENFGIRIPLIRQKTPRESAMNSPNMEQHGIYLNWLKKPHKNSTNGTDAIALYRFLDGVDRRPDVLAKQYRPDADGDPIPITYCREIINDCPKKNYPPSEFYGKVQIGQKGQVFNMIFDTAWQTSWVLSKDCEWTTVGCWFHNKYDHSVSSTYVANGTKFIADEGSYNLTGYYSNDTFSIAHSRVDGQLFVEMTYVPYTYVYSKADGVMGLGFKTGKIDPFFYNLMKNKSVVQPLFSVYLNRDRQSSRGGNILLGFIDEKHIHQKPGPNGPVLEPITYLPVNPANGFWQFKLDRIVLDLPSKNKTYPYCAKGCQAIADTTNTVIIGPNEDIQAMHKLMDAKHLAFGRYRVACDTVNKLPPIDFVLAGKNFTLKGEHYVQKMSLGAVTICVSAFVGPSASSEQDYWILGGAFLAHFYSIYDIGNTRIGFVTAA